MNDKTKIPTSVSVCMSNISIIMVTLIMLWYENDVFCFCVAFLFFFVILKVCERRAHATKREKNDQQSHLHASNYHNVLHSYFFSIIRSFVRSDIHSFICGVSSSILVTVYASYTLCIWCKCFFHLCLRSCTRLRFALHTVWLCASHTQHC